MKWIHQRNGVTRRELSNKFEIERATTQRDLKLLKDAEFIIFSGPDKSGKYILTDKGTELFNKY